jgi:hypothetical protein
MKLKTFLKTDIMKLFYGKIWLLLILILFNQKDILSQNNVIKIDFAGAIGGVFRPSFERTFGNNLSLLATFETGKYQSATSGNLKSQKEVYFIKGWGVMSEIRYYPFTKRKIAPLGFFLGLHCRYRIISESFTDSKIINSSPVYADTAITNEGTIFDYGLNFGYKIPLGRLGIDILMGYGNSSGSWKSENNRNMIDSFHRMNFDDFQNRFRFEIAIGYVFPKIKTKPKDIKVIDGPYLEH